MNSTKAKDATIARLKRELATAQRDVIKSAAVFSSIGDGVIVTDEYGRVEQVNDRARAILGYSSREILGKHFIEVVRAVNEDGSPIEPIDRPITRAFLSGMAVVERTHYLTKDGQKFPVAINVSPVMIDGSPNGAIEVFSDLTDQLIKEKIQSEFISIASHQLRTPLSAINTYAQMLSGGYAGKMNARQLNFVSVIESSAERMNELIHSLLNITRIEAGNISVNVKPVEVDQICDEIISLLQPLAEDKNIEVSYDSPTNLTIETDPILLREILSNLVSNAIKYTPNNGKVELKVSVEERLVFRVTDNGYGIPEQAKEYVFAKFYRAQNAVQYDVSGTGIGLYLAKQIAHRLDGDLWFESKVAKGSTFYFSLPLIGSLRKQGRFTLEIPN